MSAMTRSSNVGAAVSVKGSSFAGRGVAEMDGGLGHAACRGNDGMKAGTLTNGPPTVDVGHHAGMADPSRASDRPPTTSTFDAAAWGERPFSGTKHEAVLFDGVDLADLTIRGASFDGCTFRDCRFNASTLLEPP